MVQLYKVNYKSFPRLHYASPATSASPPTSPASADRLSPLPPPFSEEDEDE